MFHLYFLSESDNVLNTKFLEFNLIKRCDYNKSLNKK